MCTRVRRLVFCSCCFVHTNIKQKNTRLQLSALVRVNEALVLLGNIVIVNFPFNYDRMRNATPP